MANGSLAYQTVQPSLGGTTGRLPKKPKLSNAVMQGMGKPLPYQPQYQSVTPDQAVQMGRQDVSTPQGALQYGAPTLASRLFNQQDVAGGQQILANRAAGNDQLRQQMLSRLGNRGATPGERVLGMPEQAPVQQHVPGQMIPATPQQQAQQRELLDVIANRDAIRGQMRENIAAAGGVRQPRTSGLGGLIDRVLPPKQLTPEDVSRVHPFFAEQALKMEAQKAKRQAYLGSDEFRKRDSALAQREANVTMNAMQRGANRAARVEDVKSGGPQQRLLYNQMMARNPALALGMMRMNSENQRAAMARDLAREEIGLRREISQSGLDETKAARLQENQQRQAELAQQNQQFGQTLQQQGQQFSGAQATQQRQFESAEQRAAREHKERLQQGEQQIEATKAGTATAQAGAKTAEAQTRAQIDESLKADFPDPTERAARVDAMMKGIPYTEPTSEATSKVPSELERLYKSGDFAGLERRAREMGYDWKKLRKIYGDLGASALSRPGNPQGSLMGDIWSFGSPMGMLNKILQRGFKPANW